MKVQQIIEEKIKNSLKPDHLEVINESHKHNVPPGSESHFRVVVVAAIFENKTLVEQHRLVQELLRTELSHKIHALSLVTRTPQEWKDKESNLPKSPPCMHK
jgi:BolA protein|tara:strand:- start:417 stop:722 length:306 start_codon:yes stop_codon:yes gene_type:complete